MRYRYDTLTMNKQIDALVAPEHFAKAPDLLGFFNGALGFASIEAVVITGADGPDSAFGLKGLAHRATDKITAVARGGGRLKSGGIYVHRWFTIDHAAQEKFVELSKAAWPAFERDYDTTIFGLFAADRTAREMEEGAARMLLLTHYASHDVWEQSRNPKQEAFDNFRQRHAITRTTVARSSTLVLG